MPSEKFAAASTPMPAFAAMSRIAASCACQPVVPITTLILRAASCGRFFAHRIGQREVDRHVDVAELPVGDRAFARLLVDHAGDRRAVFGRQRFDQPAHAAVAEQQDAHQLLPSPRSARATHRAMKLRHQSPFTSSRRREELLVDAPERRGRSASRITNVMFRRDAACDTIRSGTSPTDASTCAARRRIVVQAVADHADDRHLVLALDLAQTPTAPR